MFNGNGGVRVPPENMKTYEMKEKSAMRSADANRVKRTLTALLLVFVLSFGTVFAETDGQTDAAAGEGIQTETPAETGDGESGTAVEGGEAGESGETGQSGETAETGSDTQDPAVQPETPAAEEPAPKPAPAPVSRIIKKGKYYYYKYPNGKIRKKAGFVTDLGKRYYIRKGGRIRTSKTFRIKKKYYRANKYGVIKTGVYKWKGKYYYSNAKGQVKKSAGFVTWKGNRYYVRKGGKIITGEAFAEKNIPYKADSCGRLTKLKIPDGDGSAVIEVAKAQVGMMTGKKYWEWYYKTKFRNTDITPWCGAFVAWCYNEAGVYDKISIAKKYGPLGYVPTYSRFANKHDKWINRNDAKGGDIIVFGMNMHVGLVEGSYGNYIITIEGNAGPTAAWGCGKPGACVRKIYKKNSSKIKGVLRP